MAKRLTTIGKVLYATTIGNYIGSQSKANIKLIINENIESFLAKQRPIVWNENISFMLATAKGLSEGFSDQTVMRNYSDWWRKGEFSLDGKIDVKKHANDIQSILNYELTRSTENIGAVKADKNDSSGLFKVIPAAVIAYSTAKSENILNDDIMNDIHSLLSLSYNYPRAIIVAGTFSFLIANIISGKNIVESLDQSIMYAYEFYSRRVMFQIDLRILNEINVPDFSSLKLSKIPNNNSAISLLERLYWILYKELSLEKSIELAVNDFNSNKSDLISLIYLIFGLRKRNNINDDLIDYLDSQTDIVNDLYKVVNKSSKYIIK
ncbi:MAG: ADP-ribosylglycohydrolase family protein [Lactobacillaceae bacterium]|jgi:hypothetical protein|nr:ADP-ribosylglycohydrolase family protein [Lactobacillaceae bacterium]